MGIQFLAPFTYLWKQYQNEVNFIARRTGSTSQSMDRLFGFPPKVIRLITTSYRQRAQTANHFVSTAIDLIDILGESCSPDLVHSFKWSTFGKAFTSAQLFRRGMAEEMYSVIFTTSP